ncbi:MAG: DUF3006 domain-containing protein [Patescibacteria group bacterium]
MTERPYHLKGVIDRFEEKNAVIRTDDQQEVFWPIKNLPEHVKEGSTLRLVATTNMTDQEEREEIAKALLNRILLNAQS